MTAESWKAFLSEWSKAVLSSALAEVFPPEVRSSGWIGAPGAAAADLAQAEARLNTTFPPSYREFLSLSNGWPVMLPHLGRLWSSTEIDWLVSRRTGLVENWLLWQDDDAPQPSVPDEDYFVYGKAQAPALFRHEYLRSLLEISDYDEQEDGIYLLNPRIVSNQGEWEAWYLSSNLPGAVRYPSFWEMMQAAYEGFLAEISAGKSYPPMQITAIKQFLFPVPHEARVVDLAGLIQALQHEADVHLSMKSPRHGQPPTLPGYQQNVAEGILSAEAKVREIQAGIQDAADVQHQLEVLADILESESRQGVKAALKGMDLGQLFLAGMKDKLTGGQKNLDEQFQSSGKTAGIMAAAGIIRSFLKSPS